jgi:hypothetical protein
MSVPALLAAVGDVVLVAAHGVVGHVWHRAQLRRVTLAPTALVGDAEVARAFFTVTWHIVTAVFAACAVVLAAAGLGALDSPALVRFVAWLHVGFLATAGCFALPRGLALVRPMPAIALGGMIAGMVGAFLA